METLRYVCHTVGTLEVPGEISLIYTISGCPLRCPGCHSADLRNPRLGTVLDAAALSHALSQYRGLATCVCFLGGEWQPGPLAELLDLARCEGFATCLYTGRNYVDDFLAARLDYVKLGPYVAELGGLDDSRTNQRFIDLRSGADITRRFRESPAAALSRAA